MGAQNSHKSRSQLKHSRRQNGDTKRVQQQGPTNVRRLSIKFRLPPTTRRQRFLHLCSRAPLHCHVESRQRLLVEVFLLVLSVNPKELYKKNYFPKTWSPLAKFSSFLVQRLFVKATNIGSSKRQVSDLQ